MRIGAFRHYDLEYVSVMSALRDSSLAAGTTLAFIRPMLPTLIKAPPKGYDWLHEIKYDGYRTELIVDRGTVRAFARNGHDWTDRYSSIVGAAAALPASTAIIDGEIVVQDENGVTDFQALRSAMAGEPQRLTFFAFDLLHLDWISDKNRSRIAGPSY